MYHVIAYHGKGKNREVEHDLRLLWDSLRNFAKRRNIHHVYCFQAVNEGRETNLLLVVQYEDNVGARFIAPEPDKFGSINRTPTISSRECVDYWFFIREGRR